MQLYIDQGNTALKWQLVDQGVLLNRGRVENTLDLNDALSEVSACRLGDIFVASVVAPAFSEELKAWAKQHKKPAPTFFISSRSACGVTNAYEDAAQLGVDRWLALIAAHHKYAGLLCVVDSGTALTMDFLMPDGRHLGGFIVPGAALMQNSLLKNTRQIKVKEITLSTQLGRDTNEAVSFGIQQMMQLFIKGKVAAVASEQQQKVSLILAGGHAKVLSEGLLMPVNLEEDLVLQGLQLLAKE